MQSWPRKHVFYPFRFFGGNFWFSPIFSHPKIAILFGAQLWSIWSLTFLASGVAYVHVWLRPVPDHGKGTVGGRGLKAWLEQSLPEGFTQMAPIILLELKKNHIINLHMLISLQDADLGKSLDQLPFSEGVKAFRRLFFEEESDRRRAGARAFSHR